MATTLERVQAIAVERLGVDADQVVESAEFIGDLNADSLDLVEVIMAMEQEFGVEIADEDAENIRTVGDAVKYIDEHAQSWSLLSDADDVCRETQSGSHAAAAFLSGFNRSPANRVSILVVSEHSDGPRRIIASMIGTVYWPWVARPQNGVMPKWPA